MIHYRVLKEIVFSNDPHGSVITHRYKPGRILDPEDRKACPLELEKIFLKNGKLKKVEGTKIEEVPEKKEEPEAEIKPGTEWVHETKSPYPGFNELSDKLNAVLSLMYRGFDDGDIMKKLKIKPGTFRQYVSKILKKLGVKSRKEAIKRVNEKIESKKKSASESSEAKEAETEEA